jgi:hypothetical protein
MRSDVKKEIAFFQEIPIVLDSLTSFPIYFDNRAIVVFGNSIREKISIPDLGTFETLSCRLKNHASYRYYHDRRGPGRLYLLRLNNSQKTGSGACNTPPEGRDQYHI